MVQVVTGLPLRLKLDMDFLHYDAVVMPGK